MQDAYGNAQDYIIHQQDTIHAIVAGQEFMIPYAYPSAVTALSFATAGNYSLEIWMESPRLTPRQLIGNYTLMVTIGGVSPAATRVFFLEFALSPSHMPSKHDHCRYNTIYGSPCHVGYRISHWYILPLHHYTVQYS